MDNNSELSISNVIAAKNNGRLGTTIGHLNDHLNSMSIKKYPRGSHCYNNCQFCGTGTSNHCDKCGAFLCGFTKWGKGKVENKTCFIDYHDLHCFGLAKCDYKVSGKDVSKWSQPSEEERNANKEYIDSLLKNELPSQIEHAKDSIECTLIDNNIQIS